MRNKPALHKTRRAVRQTTGRYAMGVVIAADGQRWGGDRGRRTELVMDRQTERERK